MLQCVQQWEEKNIPITHLPVVPVEQGVWMDLHGVRGHQVVSPARSSGGLRVQYVYLHVCVYTYIGI